MVAMTETVNENIEGLTGWAIAIILSKIYIRDCLEIRSFSDLRHIIVYNPDLLILRSWAAVGYVLTSINEIILFILNSTMISNVLLLVLIGIISGLVQRKRHHEYTILQNKLKKLSSPTGKKLSSNSKELDEVPYIEFNNTKAQVVKSTTNPMRSPEISLNSQKDAKNTTSKNTTPLNPEKTAALRFERLSHSPNPLQVRSPLATPPSQSMRMRRELFSSPIESAPKTAMVELESFYENVNNASAGELRTLSSDAEDGGNLKKCVMIQDNPLPPSPKLSKRPPSPLRILANRLTTNPFTSSDKTTTKNNNITQNSNSSKQIPNATSSSPLNNTAAIDRVNAAATAGAVVASNSRGSSGVTANTAARSLRTRTEITPTTPTSGTSGLPSSNGEKAVTFWDRVTGRNSPSTTTTSETPSRSSSASKASTFLGRGSPSNNNNLSRKSSPATNGNNTVIASTGTTSPSKTQQQKLLKLRQPSPQQHHLTSASLQINTTPEMLAKKIYFVGIDPIKDKDSEETETEKSSPESPHNADGANLSSSADYSPVPLNYISPFNTGPNSRTSTPGNSSKQVLRKGVLNSANKGVTGENNDDNIIAIAASRLNINSANKSSSHGQLSLQDSLTKNEESVEDNDSGTIISSSVDDRDEDNNDVQLRLPYATSPSTTVKGKSGSPHLPPTSALLQRRKQQSLIEETMQKSVIEPHVLLGWRVHVSGETYGSGVIIDLQRRKFATTKFVVRFDNAAQGEVALALKRGDRKGNIPFILVEQVTQA